MRPAAAVCLPIVHINSFPGIGKLTIARKLVDLLKPFNGKAGPQPSFD